MQISDSPSRDPEQPGPSGFDDDIDGADSAIPLTDETALRILNLLFALNTSPRPLTTDRIISDSDLGYGSGNRESDRRKFQRDRERLADHGIVVREVRASGMSETEESSWEIDRGSTHAEHGDLSADDASIVLAAIDETFELHADNPERWPLQRAYLKLKELAGLALSGDAADDATFASSFSPTLQAIWSAFMSRRPARFTYRDAHGSETQREVELYGTFAQGRRSYLVGFDRAAQGMRTFRTDRIVRARHTPASAGTYEIPPAFDVESYQFLPFDFSTDKPVDASFCFAAETGEHELALLTRGRGKLRRDAEAGAWNWSVDVRDVRAGASFALTHARLGMRPLSPAALVASWRELIGKAVAAHEGIEC